MIEKVINYKVRLTTYTKTELQFYLKIIFTKNISNKETKNLIKALAENHTSKIKDITEITNQEINQVSKFHNMLYEYFYDGHFKKIFLKTCPFCGKRPDIRIESNHFAFVCSDCKFAMRDLSFINLKNRWNHRWCADVCILERPNLRSDCEV